jgi:predicted 2-oxoglutarate/Fe(II)-dependent dioxygenase YbiX
MALEGPPRSDVQPKPVGPANRGWLDPFPTLHSYSPPAELPARGWWAGDPETVPLVHPRNVPSDILVIENFISREHCALIRQAFDASRGNLAANPVDSFWDNRLVWFNQIDASAVAAKAVMQQARFVIAYRIAEHFQTERRLYSDSQQLVLWNEGHSMPVHVDNAHPDGSQHNTPHRDFAAVLYLNEEFEGGEVYFPLQKVRIRPSTGLLIGFPGTAAAPHGVTAVRRGERFTMPCWYSFDPRVAEREMFSIF